jgi:hypothetical protein
MAQMNTAIPMMGMQPDFVNVLAQSSQAAGMTNAVQQQNALAQIYRTQGADILAGQPNAMNALASIDPTLALGIQDQRQTMAARTQAMEMSQEEMRMRREANARAAEEWAMTLDANQRAAELQRGTEMMGRFIAADNPAAWSALMTSLGKPDVPFTERGAMIDRMRDPIDALARYDAQNAPAAVPDSVIALRMRAADAGLQPGTPEYAAFMANGGQPPSQVPDSVTALRMRAADAGLTPGTQAYADFMRLGGQQPATPTNIINTGDNSNAFTKAGDEAAAARFGGYIEAGNRATELMGDLQTLAQIAGQVETGLGAQVTAALGPLAQELGVDVQGLGELQAFQSIVDRLAPALRPPGSGASSDTDVRLFLSSLPNLGRTAEGNAIINQTFTALMQHRQAVAEIAAQAFESGTWQDAEAKIRALGNPFEAFNAYNQSVVTTGGAGFQAAPEAVPEATLAPDGYPVVSSQEEYDALPPGATFRADDGRLMRKPEGQ